MVDIDLLTRSQGSNVNWSIFRIFTPFGIRILHEFHSNFPWLLFWTIYTRGKDTIDLDLNTCTCMYIFKATGVKFFSVLSGRANLVCNTILGVMWSVRHIIYMYMCNIHLHVCTCVCMYWKLILIGKKVLKYGNSKSWKSVFTIFSYHLSGSLRPSSVASGIAKSHIMVKNWIWSQGVFPSLPLYYLVPEPGPPTHMWICIHCSAEKGVFIMGLLRTPKLKKVFQNKGVHVYFTMDGSNSAISQYIFSQGFKAWSTAIDYDLLFLQIK